MSRRKKKLTTDAFSNPVYRLGFGTQAPLEATEYPLTRLTDNYALLNSLYRSGSILQSVVDIVPQDMLREWFEIGGTIKPEDQDALARAMRKTRLRDKIDEGLRWGRLYGGAVGVIMIKGQERSLDKPLKIDSITPDSFAGLLILDRWSGVFPELEVVTDISDPDFGLPEYYSINSGDNGKVVARVHHSRVVRFTGRELPFFEKLAEMYWGESEVEPIFTDIRLYDNVMANLGNLTFRANTDTMSIKNLEQLFSIGSIEQQKRFWNMMQAQSVAQSNFGYRLIDQENTVQNTQYTFTGWNYVIEAVQVNLSGSTHIPATKLFGRSPAGMNATGESDLQNYYDFIDGQREAKLRPVLEKLLPVLCMSVIGEVPGDAEINFPPLWTPTAMELAQIASAKSQAILGAFSSSALTLGQAQKELKKLAAETGMFDSIEDKDIKTNMETTYQDLTAMADPMAGLFGGGDEPAGAEEDNPFEATASDGGPGSGNFGHAGRPGQVGGSAKVSSGIPGRQVPGITPDLSENYADLASALIDIEDKIRYNTFEVAVVVSEDGKVLLNTTTSNSGEVEFTQDELALLGPGCVLTHNHPGGYDINYVDIRFAVNNRLTSIRACHANGVNTLTNKTGTDGRALLRAYRAAVKADYRTSIAPLLESIVGLNDEEKALLGAKMISYGGGNWLERNAEKYGWEYIRR